MSSNWHYLANLKPSSNGFKRNQFSHTQLLVFIIAFSVIGVVLWKSFAAPNPNLLGDLNGDNVVNAADLSILLSNYGTTNSVADINGDGQVSVADLSILLSHYGQTFSGGFTNTSLPTVSGTTTVGSVLTATNGTWTPTPTSYVYAWQICDSSGNNCSRSSTSVPTSNTYTLQASDAGHTVRVQVAPNGGNVSVDSQPTALVDAGGGGGGGNGTVLFDGSATKMTTLDVHEVCGTCGYTNGPITWTQSPYGTHYFYLAQSPSNTWDCLCFIKNDLTLASDGTFGKVYNVSVSTGDTNEWQGSLVINGAGEMSKIRPSGLGTTEWDAIAVKVPSWSGSVSDVRFLDLMSLGYQTSSNDQVGLGMRVNGSGQFGYYVAINGGETGQNGNGTVQGNAPGTSNYVDDLPTTVTFGQWEEFVFGMKWSTNTHTGFVQIYHRTPGGSWSRIYDRENIDTYLWGNITNSNGALIEDFAPDASNWGEVIDKIGLYFGTHDNAQVTENVQESGLTRSSDLPTAESTLP